MSVSAHLNNLLPKTKIINSKFPNGQIIRSTMECELDLPMLQNIAIQAHILPSIKNVLLSIGKLCYVGFTVTFNIKDVTVVYTDSIILLGWINCHNKLWYF